MQSISKAAAFACRPVTAGSPRLADAGVYWVGTASNDQLLGSDHDDVMLGLGGDDVLQGCAGRDVVLGGTGDDVLFAGEGNDLLAGGPGRDRLLGGSGDDDLVGAEGDDVLIGGGGFDAMRGDAGADTFVWLMPVARDEVDYIEDFMPDEDRLDVRGFYAGVVGESIRRTSVQLRVDSEGSTQLLLQRESGEGEGGQYFNQSITLGSLDMTRGGAISAQQALELMLAAGTLVLE